MNRAPSAQAILSEIVSDILDAANVTVPSILEEYAACMHRWIPLVTLDQLKQEGGQRNGPILILAIFLVTRRPGPHTELLRTGVLYSTLKEMLVIAQTEEEMHLELIQAHMILAIYECGHGMAKQASVSLSTCAAMAQLLDLKFQQRNVPPDEEMLVPLHVAILVLDR
jgi:hypothetical protein